jgi:hypothetical protein
VTRALRFEWIDRRRPLAWLAIALTLAPAACRFGGPSGDPSAYETFPSDGGQDATADADASAPPSDLDAAEDAGDDAGSDDGETGAGDGPVDAPAEARASSDACGGTIPVCDPIHDTGCNPFQQCDVDPSQTSTPTGLCVFNGGSSDGAPCSSSVLNESCPPEFTCSSGECRPLCACDADCPIGQCCSDTTGPAGFVLCAPCP